MMMIKKNKEEVEGDPKTSLESLSLSVLEISFTSRLRLG